MKSAYYDPKTDTIHNAEPGSYKWYHEDRHRHQYKKGKAEMLDSLYVICYYTSFIAAAGGFIVNGPWGMIEGIGFSFLPHVISMAYLEADAYIYGYINYQKSKAVNTNGKNL